MKFVKRIFSMLDIVKELMSFFWKNKLWWMIPIFLVFLLLGILVLFAQSTAVVPFIYTLF